MNRNLVFKLWIVLAVLLAGGTAWVTLDQKTTRERQVLQTANEERMEVEGRISRMEADLEEIRQHARAQSENESQARRIAAKEFSAVVAAEPEIEWVEPPDAFPDWNPESPYVWLSKDSLKKFPLPVFDASGRVNPEVAAVLALPSADLAALNGKLTALIREFREFEAASVVTTNAHLHGVADRAGDKITIVVPPNVEVGQRFKEQLVSALRTGLGAQRFELVSALGSGWLDRELSRYATEPKIISVLRHPNGTFSVSTKAGHGWMSTGGMRTLDDGVPGHLLHFFARLQPEAAAAEPTE